MHIVRLIQTHNWTKLRRSSAKLPWSCGAALLWRFSLSQTKPRNVAEFATGITIFCRRRALSPITTTCPRIRPATTGPEAESTDLSDLRTILAASASSVLATSLIRICCSAGELINGRHRCRTTTNLAALASALSFHRETVIRGRFTERP